jgi:hypothetical protein
MYFFEVSLKTVLLRVVYDSNQYIPAIRPYKKIMSHGNMIIFVKDIRSLEAWHFCYLVTKH